LFTHNGLWIAKGENPVYLLPSMANRHGLIAGATGTGKTVTLKVMAESFSDMGGSCLPG
jgi:type IV secretory pathway VirB4 component